MILVTLLLFLLSTCGILEAFSLDEKSVIDGSMLALKAAKFFVRGSTKVAKHIVDTTNGTSLIERIEGTTNAVTWYAMIRLCKHDPQHLGCDEILNGLTDEEKKTVSNLEALELGLRVYGKMWVCGMTGVTNSTMRSNEIEQKCFGRSLTYEEALSSLYVEEFLEFVVDSTGVISENLLEVFNVVLDRWATEFGLN
jgi:hypothetical protein